MVRGTLVPMDDDELKPAAGADARSTCWTVYAAWAAGALVLAVILAVLVSPDLANSLCILVDVPRTARKSRGGHRR